MKFITILILVLYFPIQDICYAQGPACEYYNTYGHITGFVETDTAIFIASTGGLVVHNKVSGIDQFLNHLNSPLPNNWINVMLKDPHGNIWMGTNERGLVRYNGQNWTVFDTTNSLLPDNRITALCCDSTGCIWIGSWWGKTAKYDGISWTNFPSAPFTYSITVMACDKLNRIWYGTYLDGLYRFDGNTWTLFDTNNSPIPANYPIRAITADTLGNVWMGDYWHVYKYNSQGFIVQNIPGTNTNPRVLYIDALSNLWIGNTFEGLIKFDGTNATIYNTTNSGIISNKILHVLVDENGNVWAGTDRIGISCFDGQNWNNNNLTSSLVNRYIYSSITVEEQTSQVWMDNWGLMMFDGSSWTNFNPQNSGLISTMITDICIDTGATKCIAMDDNAYGGLALFNNQTWTIHNAVSGLSNHCYAVDATNSGKLLVGDFNGIIYEFTGNGWISYTAANLFINNINDITHDQNGNFWISTRRTGLWKFDGTTFTNYNPSNSGLTDTCINCAVTDNAGNVWIGTRNQGLVKFDGTNWTVYNTSNSGLPNNAIHSLATDHLNNLWLTPYYSGLAKFDGTNWTCYTTWNSCIHTRFLTVITIDKSGNIWLGSQNGLMKIGGLIAEVPDNEFNWHTSCYPNPFSDQIQISISTSGEGSFSVEIHTIYGQLIETLHQGSLTPGEHKFRWNSGDAAPGVYFFRVTDGRSQVVRKVVKM